jgi:RNA polymerase sigma-70 factor (ECF subfamily)
VAVGTIKSRCARGRARLLPFLAHLGPRAVADTPALTETTRGLERSAAHSVRRGFAGSGPLVAPTSSPSKDLQSRRPAATEADGHQDPAQRDTVIGRNPEATAPVKPASARPNAVTPKVTGASGSVTIEGGDHDHAP